MVKSQCVLSRKNQVPHVKSEATESPIVRLNWCPVCLSFDFCLSYSYHSSLVIGMLLRLFGIKECAPGTRSIGPVWPLSEVGTWVRSLLLKLLPPHNTDKPSRYGYQNTHTHVIFKKIFNFYNQRTQKLGFVYF